MPSNAGLPSFKWAQSRPRQVLLFVAIVWAIAGAFQILNYGVSSLLDFAIQDNRIPDTLLMPGTKKFADCSGVIRTGPQFRPDSVALRQARLKVYVLGRLLGQAAGFRNAMAGNTNPALEATLTQLEQTRAKLASSMGLPTPGVPPIHHIAMVLPEFEEYIQTDPECIGARIAARYSAQHDALYRFGAFAGHSLVSRIASPFDPKFVNDLRYYGNVAGIPDEVWYPLAVPSRSAPGAQAIAESDAIAHRITEYLQAQAMPDASPP